MTPALLALAVLGASLQVDVYVPLCDAALIACGQGKAGDPRALDGNLYWGAAYGAERFLARRPSYTVRVRKDRPVDGRPELLREVRLTRTAGPEEQAIEIRLLAYAGDAIDTALRDFLTAASGGSAADVVVWMGHDRLMDVPAPAIAAGAKGKPVIVLACSSEAFFGPVLTRLGARPLAMTRTFMAPEAYLLDAALGVLAREGVAAPGLREALVTSYARFQRITPRAAGSVFSRLP